MDLDGDGIKDIISGNYVTDNEKGIGRVYILKGLGEGKYSKATEVLNKNGKPVIGAKTPKGRDSYNTGQICIHPFAADWDADGDLDLIIGNFDGSFSLVINEKQSAGYSFASSGLLLKDKSNNILLSGGIHSAPTLIDWDKDGDLDLLASNVDTILCISLNSGTNKVPTLESFKTLISNESNGPLTGSSYSKFKPAGSYRSWIADINKDGKLDILVGDQATIENPKPGFTKEQIAEKQATWEADLKEAQKPLQGITQKINELSAAGKDPTADEEFMKRYRELSKPYSTVYAKRSEFIDSKYTGHVWLYLAQ